MLTWIDRLPTAARAVLLVACVAIGGVVGLLVRDATTDRSTEVLGVVVTPTPTPSVDCDARPERCSTSAWSLEVSDGLVTTFVSSLGPLSREAVGDPAHPVLTLDARALNDEGEVVSEGEPVRTVRMELRVGNDTDRVFTFPDGELGVRMTRDGAPLETVVHRAGPTRLEPGDEMAATIAVEVPGDGTYAWRGVTRYEADG